MKTCERGKYDHHRWETDQEVCVCGMYRWSGKEGEPPTLTDTRAIAFNRGFDAFPCGGGNPYEVNTSEYRFWMDGYELAWLQEEVM